MIENTHEPIVSIETFETAKAKRKIRHTDNSQSRRSLGSRYLFSGKLKCGDCGFHFQGITKKKKDWSSEGYICGGYKLRGKHTCCDWFLPSDVIEPVVFEALDKEVRMIDISNAIGKAVEELGDAPAFAERKRNELTRKLCEIEEKLDNLLECIKPENKNIITEKMVALRAERDRIRNEIDDTAILQKKAIASTKLVGRLVKLAGELRELWAVATLSEKKEFVSLMVDSISIHPKGKKAEIKLSRNYLETMENLPVKKAGSFLLDGRGERI